MARTKKPKFTQRSRRTFSKEFKQANQDTPLTRFGDRDQRDLYCNSSKVQMHVRLGEYCFYSFFLSAGKQVPVATNHLVCLMADPVVNYPLFDTCCCTVAAK